MTSPPSGRESLAKLATSRLIARSYDRRARAFSRREGDDFPALGLELHGGERLLDVGCGAGASLKRFMNHHGSPASCVGLDLSEAMLRRARTETAVEALPARVEWVLGDAERLPFESNSFDFCIAVNSLSHFKDLGESLNNLFQTLCPAGRAAIKCKGDLTLDRPIEAAFRRALAAELHTEQLTAVTSMFDPASAAEAHRSARDAGFREIDVSTSREDWISDPEEEIPRFIDVAGYMLEPLSPRQREAVCRRFAEFVRADSGSNGLADFSYSVTVIARRPR